MDDGNLSRSERTRSDIIQAAHSLFVKQGYHGTSMRQISKYANCALGGLYNHFDSKEKIFRAVFLEYHPYNSVLPALLSAQGQTVDELVRNGATLMVQSVKDRPDFLNLMFIEMVEFENAHVKELFSDLFPIGLQIAQGMIQTGGQRLRPIPAPILLRSFLGLFFSYYLTEIVLGPVAPPQFGENAMDYFVDIYLHGLLKCEQSSFTEIAKE